MGCFVGLWGWGGEVGVECGCGWRELVGCVLELVELVEQCWVEGVAVRRVEALVQIGVDIGGEFIEVGLFDLGGFCQLLLACRGGLVGVCCFVCQLVEVVDLVCGDYQVW